MKKISLLFITILSFQFSFSQGGIWTWISGSNNPADPGVYGIQGVPSVLNRPRAAYEYTEWKDKLGNFWIYGGTHDVTTDLWKFNPQTLEWTWVKGTGFVQWAFYGIQGISDPQNTPGARRYAAAAWTDTTGNLWLFGGQAPGGECNDLWKYDISTNEWTWLKGSSFQMVVGNHGVQGIPSPLNNPGARSEVATAWTDSMNNLWLFGGYGIDDFGNWGNLNDLMKYDISTNEWTWMKGSDSANISPVWGTKNVSNALNDPGGRCTYTHWVDSVGGLWLMGGTKILTNECMNDVWRYDLNNNEWTWKTGTNLLNDSGNYQITCLFDSINNPGSRFENRSCAQDNCGRFWFYGGLSYDITYMLNDLWIFNPSTSEWAWLSGNYLPNQPFNYGSLGIPSATNSPPYRGGAVSWWGNDNRFYLFGGLFNLFQSSSLNDVWVFTPDSFYITMCQGIAMAQFISTDSVCPGTCIDFTNLSYNASGYVWYFPGAIPDNSTMENPVNICYTTPGSYDVQLIALNAIGSDTLLLSNYITVLLQPQAQSITQNGDTLFAIAGADFYQWYFNGNLIPGATNSLYIAPASGDYNVIATDNNGCEVEAVINNVIAKTTLLSLVEESGVRFFPNPVTEKLYLYFNLPLVPAESRVKIFIYNLFGEKIISKSVSLIPSSEIDVHELSSGLYYVEIIFGNKSYRTKFMKQ